MAVDPQPLAGLFEFDKCLDGLGLDRGYGVWVIFDRGAGRPGTDAGDGGASAEVSLCATDSFHGRPVT